MKIIDLDPIDKRDFIIRQMKQDNRLDKAIRRDEAKVWPEMPPAPTNYPPEKKWSKTSLYAFAKGLMP